MSEESTLLLLEIADELEKQSRRVQFSDWRLEGVRVGLLRFASNVRAIANGAGSVIPRPTKGKKR